MESEGIDPANEWAIKPVVAKFSSGVRDFLLVTRESNDVVRAIHPLDLLGLDRAAEEIRRTEQKDPVLARRLALCRLLVPCLRYRAAAVTSYSSRGRTPTSGATPSPSTCGRRWPGSCPSSRPNRTGR